MGKKSLTSGFRRFIHKDPFFESAAFLALYDLDGFDVLYKFSAQCDDCIDDLKKVGKLFFYVIIFNRVLKFGGLFGRFL